MDHAYILKTAYKVTKQYPKLWFLGVFLATGFNAQLLLLGGPGASKELFQIHPVAHSLSVIGLVGHSYMTPLLAVLAFIVGLLLTNWAKVILVLELQILLKLRRTTDLTDGEDGETRHLGDRRRGEGSFTSESLSETPLPATKSIIQRSGSVLGQVILVSLFTTAVMLLVLSVLSVPFLSFARDTSPFQTAVMLSALVLLVFFVFVISCVGIFASFFVILLKVKHKPAINLATDLVISKWQEIAATVLLLVIVYIGCFSAGYCVVAVSKPFFVGLISPEIVTWVQNVVLWGWLSVLNVFFYVAMILLFSRLVKPTMSEELAPGLVTGNAEAH